MAAMDAELAALESQPNLKETWESLETGKKAQIIQGKLWFQLWINDPANGGAWNSWNRAAAPPQSLPKGILAVTVEHSNEKVGEKGNMKIFYRLLIEFVGGYIYTSNPFSWSKTVKFGDDHPGSICPGGWGGVYKYHLENIQTMGVTAGEGTISDFVKSHKKKTVSPGRTNMGMEAGPPLRAGHMLRYFIELLETLSKIGNDITVENVVEFVCLGGKFQDEPIGLSEGIPPDGGGAAPGE